MKRLRIHYFQHVPFEGPGCIEDWININEHELSVTRLFENYSFPDINSVDILIVMGGSMNVNEHDKHPWLKEEKEYILKAINAGKKVLGICLGSQLIAAALGARVYPNTQKEIGWFDISKTGQGRMNNLFIPFESPFNVFHWHGDTFDIPEGATKIFESECCKNQAFIYGERVLALQFHMELRQKDLEKMIKHCKSELIEGTYIQSEEEILKNTEQIKVINSKMYLLLDNFINN